MWRRMQKNILARAFELAPQCSGTTDLRRLLVAEGYTQVNEHLGGLGTQRQLRTLFNGGAGQQKRGPKPQATSHESSEKRSLRG